MHFRVLQCLVNALIYLSHDFIDAIATVLMECGMNEEPAQQLAQDLRNWHSDRGERLPATCI